VFRDFTALTAAALFIFSALAAGAQTPVSAQSDGARRISPSELRAMYDRGEVQIVDVRGESSYTAGHVRGALWIPFNEIAARSGELARDKMIVTYCS
jgi:3-mercaptopyruvate sulfurtransferase SseA